MYIFVHPSLWVVACQDWLLLAGDELGGPVAGPDTPILSGLAWQLPRLDTTSRHTQDRRDWLGTSPAAMLVFVHAIVWPCLSSHCSNLVSVGQVVRTSIALMAWYQAPLLGQNSTIASPICAYQGQVRINVGVAFRKWYTGTWAEVLNLTKSWNALPCITRARPPFLNRGNDDHRYTCNQKASYIGLVM